PTTLRVRGAGEVQPLPLCLEAWPVEDFGVYRAARLRPEREVHHDLARGPSDVAEQLVRPRDAVRREQHVLQLAEAVGRGERLLRKAIDRGARNPAVSQRLVKRLLVHDAAA